MKSAVFATLAATLLAASSAFAAPGASQQGPGYPPLAHRPADYRGHDAYPAYGRGPRPGYREPARRAAYDHYEAGPSNPGYGYDQRPAPQPLPPPRRPVAVAIQIQL